MAYFRKVLLLIGKYRETSLDTSIEDWKGWDAWVDIDS